MLQKPWSDKETQELIRLHKTLTPSKIAKELGRSKDSVRHKLKALKAKGEVTPAAQSVKKVVSKPEKKPDSRPNAKAQSVSYPPLEWCGNCHSPVSSWVDHEARMRHMGCKRPVA